MVLVVVWVVVLVSAVGLECFSLQVGMRGETL